METEMKKEMEQEMEKQMKWEPVGQSEYQITSYQPRLKLMSITSHIFPSVVGANIVFVVVESLILIVEYSPYPR